MGSLWILATATIFFASIWAQTTDDTILAASMSTSEQATTEASTNMLTDMAASSTNQVTSTFESTINEATTASSFESTTTELTTNMAAATSDSTLASELLDVTTTQSASTTADVTTNEESTTLDTTEMTSTTTVADTTTAEAAISTAFGMAHTPAFLMRSAATDAATSTTALTTIADTTTMESATTTTVEASTFGPTGTRTLAATSIADATTNFASITSLTLATSTATVAGPSATSSIQSSTTQTASTTVSTQAASLATVLATTSVSSSTSTLGTVAQTASSFTTASVLATTGAARAVTASRSSSDVAASATASVGFTTFSAISGASTTAPSVPPTACSPQNASACCTHAPPILGSYCVGTGYKFDGQLQVDRSTASIVEPYSVMGSTLLTGSVIQVSSPTVIHGNFSVDGASVVALTQVAGLTTPLLTIAGDAHFMGTLTVTLTDGRLLAPLVVVQGRLEISGTVVPTIDKIPLFSAVSAAATDPQGDGITFRCDILLLARPPNSSYKRADPPAAILIINTSQSLEVVTQTVPFTISTQYAKKACENPYATSQKTDTSFSMLIGNQDKCGKSKLSNGAIGGIIAGGVVFVAVLILLGILAFKKGVGRKLFRSESRKDDYVN